MKFSEEQKKAIYKEGCNILVSAGAGSGKTAVLSERVLRKLEENEDIFHILILTFTNEAAKEMKERIRKKIKNKGKSLKKQLEFLDSSYITTFDSFAFSLVKKYHYLFNISSNPSIIDSSIMNLKKKKILDDIFLEYYEKKEPRFLKLIGDFTTRDDEGIKDAILKIDQSLSKRYDKRDFLKDYVKKYYQKENIEGFFQEYFLAIKKLTKEIEEIYYLLEKDLDPSLAQKLGEALKIIIDPKDYQTIYEAEIHLPVFRNLDEDLLVLKETLQEKVKELKSLCVYSKEELINQVLLTKDYASIIVDILLLLDEKLTLYKFENEAFEFIDISKMAIQVVLEHNDVREELKNQFHEIMVDEYQDTNDLQELFISLISNHNLYMVGDIKQSIYRFRNANPNIFKDKFLKYRKKIDGEAIILSKNFRSRREVLNNINEIFQNLMTDDLGGIDYHDDQAMVFGNLSYLEDKNANLEILEYDASEKEFSNSEKEAFIIARDIKEKIENKYSIYDFEVSSMRPTRYQDFCIILDRGSDMPLYKKIFEYLHIPMEVYQDSNLTTNTEIYLVKNILTMIHAIQKEKYDASFIYSFVSIARSYLISLSDEEIFQIINNQTIFDTEVFQICKKIANISNLTPKYLLEEIIQQFQIYEKLILVGNVKDVMKRFEYLLDLAENMESLGFSIHDFKDYINSILEDKMEIRYKEERQNEDCVKIMNIHQSKGLEFPICYYAGYKKKFNLQDLNDRFLYDLHYGLLIPYYKEGIGTTFIKTLIKNETIKEELSEKVRLFYVALTRAKEKMIMVIPKVESNMLTNPRSFLDFIQILKKPLSKYIKTISLEKIGLSHAYQLQSLENLKFDETKEMITFLENEIKTEVIEESHASKTIHNLISKKDNDTLLYGKKIHALLEEIDFFHYQGDNPIILHLLDTFDFKNATIYQELEFYFEEDEKEFHGIIDLALEYNDNVKIIDYKLKNIEDEAYIKQLEVYKKYMQQVSSKKVELYLYSILDKKVKEITLLTI